MAFLSDPFHPQWAGVLDPERQAQLIAGARGLSGRNIDYLRDLVERGLRADEIVRAAAKVVGGGGGGRETLARAGGRDVQKLPEAIRVARETIESGLSR